MKKIGKAFKRCLICVFVVLPLIAGAFLLGLQRADEFSGGKSNAASVEKEAFNGRDSNTIDGSGFNQSTSVGSSLQEPNYPGTWQDIYNGMSFTTLRDNASLVTPRKDIGDYRVSDANTKAEKGTGALLDQAQLNARGRSAANPWYITNAQELAFWSKYITLAYANSTNCGYAYLNAPYFELANDIDLENFRWVPPFFYSTNETLTTNDPNDEVPPASRARANRVFFNGAGHTISNAYVKQSYNGTAGTNNSTYAAYPSIFGPLTPKSQVKNLNIDKAFISEGATPSPVSIVSQSTANYDAAFTNIHVTDSVVRGGTGNGVNGIAAFSSIIKDCSVSDTTFTVTSTTTTTSAYARGMGQSAMYLNNTVDNCSLEILNQGYVSYAMGIGNLVVASAWVNGTATSDYWDYIKAGDAGFVFRGGFFNNTVSDSKISVSSTTAPVLTNGNTYNYGNAYGIGSATVVTKTAFENNKLINSYVGTKIENNPTTTESFAVGMIQLNFTPDNLDKQVVYLDDCSVINSTVSSVTQRATTAASGMFYTGSDILDVRIRRCYTENTDVISRSTTGLVYSFASGINMGYATLIEDCVVGSGNIDARSDTYPVYAYGVGSTMGRQTMIGSTGVASLTYTHSNGTVFERPYGRKYFVKNHEGDYSKDQYGNYLYYLGDQPVTTFKNCFNFSSITTSTTNVIYSAGIGMAEGFTNCVNYGNVMGNYVGGIALGFEHTPNYYPNAATLTYTSLHAVRPLIIKNCANYGNLIKAANNNTSYIGGMLSTYWNSLNYTRNWNNGSPTNVEDLDGKHLEVTNCINAGKAFFYYVVDNSFTLTKKLKDVSDSAKVFYGSLFGRILLNPYGFEIDKPVNHVLFDEFVQRFVIKNNFYSESSRFDVGDWGTATSSTWIRETGVNVEGTTNANGIDNITGYRYFSQRPSAYYMANELGVSYNALAIHDAYGFNGVNGANTASSAQIRYERVYNEIAKNWTNNSMFTSLSSTVRADMKLAGWDTSTKVPQIALDDSFPFHILAYDRDDTAQGYAPNVSIKIADELHIDYEPEFTIDAFNKAEVGVSVDEWFRFSDDGSGGYTSAPYKVGIDKLPNERKIVGAGTDVLPVTMLFANDQLIQYDVDTSTNEGADYSYSGDTTVEKAEDEKLNLTVTFTDTAGTKSVTGVKWLAKIGSGADDWRVILVETVADGNILNPSANVYKHTLTKDVDDSFILNFAGTGTNARKFIIKAEFMFDDIYDVNLEIGTIIGESPMSDASIAIDLTEYDGDEPVRLMEKTEVMLKASYNADLYDFGGFIIIGDSGEVDGDSKPIMTANNDVCYTVTGSLSSPSAKILINKKIVSISFVLNPKEYNIAIQTYVVAPSGLRSQINNDDLILTDSGDLSGIASIGSTKMTGGLKVRDTYEDVDATCFYKFAYWEYISGSAFGNGSVTDNGSVRVSGLISFTPELIKANLRDTADGRAFIVVAVFKRQVKLVINMESAYEDDNSTYEVKLGNGDEVQPIRDFGDHFGVIVDESALVIVTFSPDTRLEIATIDDVPVGDRNDYSDNKLYLTLSSLTELKVGFRTRDAKLSVRHNFAHEQDNWRTSGLGIVTTDVDDVAYELGTPNRFYVLYDNTVGAHLYRVINISIKGQQDSVSDIQITQSSTEIIANEEFFMNYVSMDGEIEINLELARIYEVSLTLTNFTRNAGTTTYADGFGNTFALIFHKNGSAIVNQTGDSTFVIDHDVEIEYLYSSNFSKYYDINVSDIEKASQFIKVTSTRQIAVSPVMFTLTISQSGKSSATIDSYTGSFGIGSIITIACTAGGAYQINNATINGKSLASLGADRKGDTITILVTPDFINAVNSTLLPEVALSMKIDTGLSDAIVYGGTGSGAALLLLSVLIVLLIMRSNNLKKQKLAREAEIRDMKRKFNISDEIEKLRSGDYDNIPQSTVKREVAATAKAPAKGAAQAAAAAPAQQAAPAASAIPNLDGCVVLQDKSIVNKNKTKIGTLKNDGTIIGTNGKVFAKADFATGAIVDTAGNALGKVQGDGSIKK